MQFVFCFIQFLNEGIVLFYNISEILPSSGRALCVHLFFEGGHTLLDLGDLVIPCGRHAFGHGAAVHLFILGLVGLYCFGFLGQFRILIDHLLVVICIETGISELIYGLSQRLHGLLRLIQLLREVAHGLLGSIGRIFSRRSKIIHLLFQRIELLLQRGYNTALISGSEFFG